VPSDKKQDAVVVPSDKKQMVREVQSMLADKGFDPGPVDGQAGPSTTTALRAFQKSEGLPYTNGVTDEAYIQLKSEEHKPQVSISNQDIQKIQQRSYIASKSVAFSAVVSALQNLGYIIESSSKDSGLIKAATSPNIQSSVLFVPGKVEQKKVLVTIEQLNSQKVNIRLNLTEKNQKVIGVPNLDNIPEKPIADPNIYEEAFSEIQSAILSRSSNK
jgi:peptidoglycan hydrolase-like protein with peptidoglycan-binding domain